MAIDSPTAPPFYPLTNDNHAALVVVTSLVFLIYSIFGTVAKLLIRLNITSMKDYDWTLLIALFLYFIQTACVIGACRSGLGQHQKTITEDAFETYSKLIYASRVLGLLVNGCTKIALCLLIRQIDNQGRLNIANVALGGIVIAWVISGFFATIFQCPVPSPWLATSKGQCPSDGPVYMYIGIVNILTDFALCMLPVAMMWEVQTTMRRKLIVMALFGTRIIVPAVTIPSLSNAHKLFKNYDDSTWDIVPSMIWFQISLGLSVLTVCIPSLKGVIDSLLGSTSVAAIQAPYDLKDSGQRSGLQLTALSDSRNSKLASRDPSRLGKLSHKSKSPDTSGWYSDRGPRSKHSASESIGGSESVRKLTEGVIVVRDEFEIQYDEGRRSTARTESQGSDDAEYGIQVHTHTPH